MTTVKAFVNELGSLHLYETKQGYITLLCMDGIEVPTLPTADLGTALDIFEHNLEILVQNKESLN
jgi:hypothetical protein